MQRWLRGDIRAGQQPSSAPAALVVQSARRGGQSLPSVALYSDTVAPATGAAACDAEVTHTSTLLPLTTNDACGALRTGRRASVRL